MAGLFGLTEAAREREFFGLGFEPVVNPANGMFQIDPQTNRPMIVPVSAFTRNKLDTDNRSLAVYGQATYSITEQLELTVGARLTKDRKEILLDTRLATCRPGLSMEALMRCRARLGQSASGPMGFTGFERSGRFDDITPNASLAYSVTSDLLLYLSYAKGFQSGGFDGRAASLADTKELANQENTTYEVGIKSNWFDNRLVVNGAYFYNILEDGTRIPVSTITDSGQLAQGQGLDARALVRGGELEIGILPTPGLQLRGSLGVQRTEIESFSRGRALGLNSEQLSISPNYTMNFSVDYERPVGRLGTLGLNTSWTHRGAQNPVIQAPKQLEVSKYGLLDGRVSLRLPDERTEVAAFGTNLLDRRYFFAGFSAQDTFGFGARFFGPPRFYGVEVRRAF